MKILESEYREAALQWLKENSNKTLADCTNGIQVTLTSGKSIRLGNRIVILRQIYNAMQKGEHFYRYKDLTEEQIKWWTDHGMNWTLKKIPTEQEYRIAALKWLEENPSKTLADCLTTEKVTLPSGETVCLGSHISHIRQSYEAIQTGKKDKNYKYIDQETIMWWQIRGVSWGIRGYNKRNKIEEECLKILKDTRRSRKKEIKDLENLHQEFQINMNEYLKYKEGTITKSSHSVQSDKEQIGKKNTVLNNQKQQVPRRWIYEKYGKLVKYILLSINLRADRILWNMKNYRISLEEAIRHEVFKMNQEGKENAWLERPYNIIIEEINDQKDERETIDDIVEKFQLIMKEYQLTREETQIIYIALSEYLKTMKNYQIIDVGLEPNKHKKQQKIQDYNLDKFDIEESFFAPLQFEKHILLKEKSPLYQRRQLLKQYTIDWDYYTEEEKTLIQLENQFTKEEIEWIENTRKDINTAIQKTMIRHY